MVEPAILLTLTKALLALMATIESAIFIAIPVATGIILTGGLIAFSRRQASRRLTDTKRTDNKWRIPPPGLNMDLYKHTKKLLDHLEADKKRAILEQNSLKKQNSELQKKVQTVEADRDRLRAKLDAAQEILRSLTNPGQKFHVTRRVQVTSVPRENSTPMTEAA